MLESAVFELLWWRYADHDTASRVHNTYTLLFLVADMIRKSLT